MLRKVKDKEFSKFAKLVYENAGIYLAPHKKTLLESRTNKILRKRNIASFEDYYNIIVEDKSGNELRDFINIISTNTTYFFREKKHFDFIQNRLFEHFNNDKPISVWCAAASTGQEPYSIAITFAELFDYNRFQLLATDIDTNVLQRAEKGIYLAEEVNMDKNLISRYFQKGIGKQDGKYRVRKYLRNKVTFNSLNLIHNFHFNATFDIIFCRNVFIYFDNHTKEKIVNRMFQYLKPGGYLFIGHSESLNTLNHPYKYVMPATYMKEK